MLGTADNMLPAMKNVAGNLSDFGGYNITLLGEISSCCRELTRLLGICNYGKEPHTKGEGVFGFVTRFGPQFR